MEIRKEMEGNQEKGNKCEWCGGDDGYFMNKKDEEKRKFCASCYEYVWRKGTESRDCVVVRNEEKSNSQNVGGENKK
ncbi:MAG: hypothetical protein ACTSXD_11670 [Candidatus Heimdallarchaeaceae archaeon]